MRVVVQAASGDSGRWLNPYLRRDFAKVFFLFDRATHDGIRLKFRFRGPDAQQAAERVRELLATDPAAFSGWKTCRGLEGWEAARQAGSRGRDAKFNDRDPSRKEMAAANRRIDALVQAKRRDL